MSITRLQALPTNIRQGYRLLALTNNHNKVPNTRERQERETGERDRRERQERETGERDRRERQERETGYRERLVKREW
jgi:hypothetical protein